MSKHSQVVQWQAENSRKRKERSITPLECAKAALPDHGEVGRPHKHFVHIEPAIYLFDQRHGGISIREKCGVGVQRIPVLFGIVLAGMSNQVYERVLPGR